MDYFSTVPRETIKEICWMMDIVQLKSFMISHRDYINLCQTILYQKIAEQKRQHKLMIKTKIELMKQAIIQGMVIDASSLNMETGKGLRKVKLPSINSRKRTIVGHPIVTTDSNYDMITDVMNTV